MELDLSEIKAPIRGTRFSKLKPGQGKVLTIYAAGAHALSDIAVELPTGAGKTLIALLILEYWRKQGRRVAILTGNKTLARQLEGEANDLRVAVVRFEGPKEQLSARDLRRYRRAEAIGVMNYWVYINQNPIVDPAEILVLDDAQLGEAALLSLFSVRISRGDHSPLFNEVMRLVAQYTDSPVADDFEKGIGGGSGSPTDLVPFSSLIDMLDEFEVLVDTELEKVDETRDWVDLRFRWNRLRRQAAQCLLLVHDEEIVLRPYIYPSEEVEHLAAPAQRIYMSATLHDPDDLRRRLGVPPITKLVIPPDLAKEEDGRRLFIFNQTSSVSTRSQPGEEVLAPLRELLKWQKKSVWLCSSGHEVKHWRAWLQDQLGKAEKSLPIWELTPTGDELVEFCGAAQGHLLIGGRFEGMDFPDDCCRLAVFPSLPRATGAMERFVSEQLKDAAFQKMRMLERVKQGIGRCTRGNQDYAIYFFLDPRFYIEMESRLFGALQSERTRKQIELGLGLTQDGMGAVLPFAKKFLAGDFTEFDAREAKANPPSVGITKLRNAVSTVSDEVEGWRAIYGTRDFLKAANRFETVSAAMGDAEREHRAFWKYLEAFAEYLRFRYDDQRQSFPATLNHLERAILEGSSSSWFNRLRKAKNRLEEVKDEPVLENYGELLDRWDEFVERYPLFKGRFLKWQASLKAHLDGSHNQVCEALETLGNLLGYHATRPGGDGAPDGHWAAPDHTVTLEAKIDVDREEVSLADVNQADGHRRAAAKAPELAEDNVISAIVTSLKAIHPIAIKALGDIRIISLDLVGELQSRLEQQMRVYWKAWSRDDAGVRRELRRSASKSLPPPGWLFRALKKAKKPFLTAQDLFGEWPP